MRNSEILSAALRWHTIHTKRLAVGRENARRLKAERSAHREGLTYIGPPTGDTGPMLTAIKRVELAALRALAKACLAARGGQDVTDVVENLPTRSRFTN